MEKTTDAKGRMQSKKAFEQAKEKLDRSLYFFLVSLDRDTSEMLMLSGLNDQFSQSAKDEFTALSHRLRQVVLDEIERNNNSYKP